MGSGRPPRRPFQRATAERELGRYGETSAERELGRYLGVSCGAEMDQHSKITAVRDLTTFGRSRAVRHPDCDYAGEIDVHLTLCAATGKPFTDASLAQFVCNSVETAATLLSFRLHGHCLMPDHLHVLLSPARSGKSVGVWLRQFKAYTSHEYRDFGGTPPLWQRSAYDHVCREGETAENVLTYIVNNPVRAGLVDCWQDWPWTKVFITI